jgi:alkylation response protein AidB-like acyl-CoA dehydrogenase
MSVDLHDGVTAAAFRSQVKDFLHELLPPGFTGIGALPDAERDSFRRQAREALRARGWWAPAWPTEYGGAGLTFEEQYLLYEELIRAGVSVVRDTDGFGISMLGNTMLRWSDDSLCQRFLPRILSGEYVFAQGFSEPDAGSDLAGLSLRATLTDGRWMLNGQKLWSSGAHTANWMFVLARTGEPGSRHRGLTMLLVPLDQSGVEVRPIRNLNDETDFNEVFFTNATTDEELVVGGIDNGWAVAMTLLGYERGEAAVVVPLQYAEELQRMRALAAERGLDDNPDYRRRLAWCQIQVQKMRAVGLRSVTALIDGKHPEAEAAVFKLLWSEYHTQASELAVDLLGPDALTPTGRSSANWFRTDDPGAPNTSATWTTTYLNARAGTIYAGTSQIQRNIVAELLLGLPRESSSLARLTAGATP